MHAKTVSIIQPESQIVLFVTRFVAELRASNVGNAEQVHGDISAEHFAVLGTIPYYIQFS